MMLDRIDCTNRIVLAGVFCDLAWIHQKMLELGVRKTLGGFSRTLRGTWRCAQASKTARAGIAVQEGRRGETAHL